MWLSNLSFCYVHITKRFKAKFIDGKAFQSGLGRVRKSTTKGCKRTRLTYIDPNGKKFKSAKDVETNLKEKGLWNEVLFDEMECKDAEEDAKKSNSEPESGSDSSDPDFKLDEEDDQNGAPLLQKE